MFNTSLRPERSQESISLAMMFVYCFCGHSDHSDHYVHTYFISILWLQMLLQGAKTTNTVHFLRERIRKFVCLLSVSRQYLGLKTITHRVNTFLYIYCGLKRENMFWHLWITYRRRHFSDVKMLTLQQHIFDKSRLSMRCIKRLFTKTTNYNFFSRDNSFSVFTF